MTYQRNTKLGCLVLVVALTGSLFSASAVSACPVEDCVEAPSSNGATTPQLVLLPALTIPYVEMDFDQMALGPTSVEEIQSTFPGSVLEDFVVTTFSGTGTYNTQSGSGLALGAIDNDGTLGIIDSNDGIFQNVSQMEIVLSEPVSEFGFGVGDWVGPFFVTLYFDDRLIASEEVETQTLNGLASFHYIQEPVLFNRVVLAPPEYLQTTSNWVIPLLAIPYASSVPVSAITPYGLILLMMVMLTVGSVWLKKQWLG